ncbi:MAG: hypothetical protein KTR31_14975 [Myxococcales bacterium]|nr:hypothetical protein [Myxococcales bacterium]
MNEDWRQAPTWRMPESGEPTPATQAAALSHLNGLEWRSLLQDPEAQEAAAADPGVRRRVLRTEAARLALSEAVELAVLARIAERRAAERSS